jgi:multidrug efflux pump subunit AcrB
MNVSELFIKRPVMTSLIMAAFLFAGLFGPQRIRACRVTSLAARAKLP